MMRWAMAISVLACAAWAAAAAAASPSVPGKRTIEGKEVIIGQTFGSQPMMEIRNIKFWDAKLDETKGQCTVITGELWNLTDGEGWLVKIEIDVWCGSREAGHLGVFSTTIDRPGKKVAIPFRLLAPGTYNKDFWRDGCRAMYLARLTVEPSQKK